MEWIEFNWIVLDWFGLHWIGMGGIGLNYIRLVDEIGWTGTDWIQLYDQLKLKKPLKLQNLQTAHFAQSLHKRNNDCHPARR